MQFGTVWYPSLHVTMALAWCTCHAYDRLCTLANVLTNPIMVFASIGSSSSSQRDFPRNGKAAKMGVAQASNASTREGQYNSSSKLNQKQMRAIIIRIYEARCEELGDWSVKLSLGNQHGKTSTQGGTTCPMWNEEVEFDVFLNSPLILQMAICSKNRSNEEINQVGLGEFHIGDFLKRKQTKIWLNLSPKGQICISSFPLWYPFNRWNLSQLHVRLERSSITGKRDKKIDPYVTMQLDDTVKETKAKSDEREPLWDETFTFDVTPSTNIQRFNVNLMDKQWLGLVGSSIGSACLDISTIPLQEGPWNGCVVFHEEKEMMGELFLRVDGSFVDNALAPPDSPFPMTNRGLSRSENEPEVSVTVVEANNLAVMPETGDICVRLTLSGSTAQPRETTPTPPLHDPLWDEQVSWKLSELGSGLLEVELIDTGAVFDLLPSGNEGEGPILGNTLGKATINFQSLGLTQDSNPLDRWVDLYDARMNRADRCVGSIHLVLDPSGGRTKAPPMLSKAAEGLRAWGITVHRAELSDYLITPSKPNPYVVLRYGADMKKTAESEFGQWNEYHEFHTPQESLSAPIIVEVWDKARADLVGQVYLDSKKLRKRPVVEEWHVLSRLGKICLSITPLWTQYNRASLRQLSVTVASAHLFKERNTDQSEHYVTLQMDKKHVSTIRKGTRMPVWDETFDFELSPVGSIPFVMETRLLNNKNSCIGSASLDIAALPLEQGSLPITVDVMDQGIPVGEVVLQVDGEFCGFDRRRLTGIRMVLVDGIDLAHHTDDEEDTFCAELFLGEQEMVRSQMSRRNRDAQHIPLWNEQLELEVCPCHYGGGRDIHSVLGGNQEDGVGGYGHCALAG